MTRDFGVVGDELLRRTLVRVAGFYDARSIGRVGGQGYRMSTRLSDLVACLERLVRARVLAVGESRFVDVGCGDGRVNVLLGYLTQVSVGLEIDSSALAVHEELRRELAAGLAAEGLLPLPDNVHLLAGDATDTQSYAPLYRSHGLRLADFDLFFNFLTLHDECAALVVEHARAGAHFVLYGADRCWPAYAGLDLIEEATSRRHQLAVYRKGDHGSETHL